jgi:hypothetical protein
MFYFGIKKWESATVEKKKVTLIHFMLVGKSTDTAVDTITCSQFSLSLSLSSFIFWCKLYHWKSLK